MVCKSVRKERVDRKGGCANSKNSSPTLSPTTKSIAGRILANFVGKSLANVGLSLANFGDYPWRMLACHWRSRRAALAIARKESAKNRIVTRPNHNVSLPMSFIDTSFRPAVAHLCSFGADCCRNVSKQQRGNPLPLLCNILHPRRRECRRGEMF
jgi:hypothetical protein